MASIEQLKDALIRADKAGDTQAAALFASEIKKLQAGEPAPTPTGEAEDFTGRVSPQGIPLRADEGLVTEEREYAPGEVAEGVGETALALGTAATGGAAGHVVGFLQGLAESLERGDYGTMEAAQRTKKLSEQLASEWTYEPRGEAGQEFTQTAAETLQPLEAFTPLAGEISAATRAIRKPKAPRPLTETEQTLVKAKELDVPVMTSDIKPPRTFMGKSAQQAGERIPVAGTGEVRKAQQAKRIQAIKDVAHTFGDDIASDHVNEIAQNLSKTRQAKINKFSDLKSGVIKKLSDDNIKVDMGKTMSAIDDQVKILEDMKTDSSLNAAKALRQYKESFSNQNLNNVEMVRKDLGNLFKREDLATIKDVGQKAVKQIYKSVNEDMGDYISKHGERTDLNKWKVGNKQLTNMAKELDSAAFKGALTSAEVEPEKAANMIFSKKPSQVKLLYKNLDREGKQAAKTAIMHRAVENAGGIDKISPAKFKTQMEKLSKNIGIVMSKEEKELLNGLSEVLSMTQRAEEFAVSRPTGAQLYAPVGAAVLADLMGGAGAGLATGGIAGASFRLYESMPIKRALKKISKAERGTPKYNTAVEELFTAINAANKGLADERTGNE